MVVKWKYIFLLCPTMFYVINCVREILDARMLLLLESDAKALYSNGRHEIHRGTVSNSQHAWYYHTTCVEVLCYKIWSFRQPHHMQLSSKRRQGECNDGFFPDIGEARGRQ